jgi:DNA-binding beta-propeller fold protein YncE
LQRRHFIGLALAGGAVASVPWALRRRRATTSSTPSIDYHASDEHLGFDGQGNAYRLDARRNQLVRLGAATTPAWSRGKTGLREGELNGPTALAFDARHRIHVADAGNRRVQVFEADGSFAHVIGKDALELPRDLAFDAKGNLYVCDTLNHRIEVFDGAGRAVSRIGSFGQGRSELNGPRALAFAPDGSLHVVDAGNARIQVFSAEGRWIDSYGGGKGESKSLVMPGSIAIGPDGRAHVADATAGAVSIFDQGRLVERFVPRDAAGRVLSPMQLTFDPHHRLRIMGTPAFAA